MEFRGYVKRKNQKGYMVEILSIDLSTTPTKYYTMDINGNQNYKVGSDLILMERTGLVDARGNHIYEGDILISHQHNDVKFTIRKIAGGFVCNTPIPEWEHDDFPYESLSDPQTKSFIESNCVIFGNIHEDID